MTLEPLLHASLPIQIHVATVVPAFLIGTYLIFISRKGAPFHRALGYIYLTLMAITATAAFFITMPAGLPRLWNWFSPIHLLVPFTLYGIYGALRSARQHNIPDHRKAMLSVYIGGILIAGSLAFMPGRVMNQIVFGA